MISGLVYMIFYFNNLILFSIGLAVVSFGVAIVSIGVALSSDEKMKDLANVNFIDIYENIQDLTLTLIPRLSINNPIENNKRSVYFWRYRNCLIHANILKKYADNIDQLNLILPLLSMLELIPWNKKLLKNNDVENILDCYKFLEEFEFDKKTKSELKNLIEKHIVIRNQNEDLIAAVDRLIERLSKNPNQPFQRKKL